MDFKAQQNSIKKYIADNFKTTLAAGHLPDMDAYIDDYLDLDKYSKAKQLFYFFNYYNYQNSDAGLYIGILQYVQGIRRKSGWHCRLRTDSER